MEDSELWVKFSYKVRGKMLTIVCKNPGIQVTAPMDRINSVSIKKEYGGYFLYLNLGGVEYNLCSSIDRSKLQEYQSKLFKDIGWM